MFGQFFRMHLMTKTPVWMLLEESMVYVPYTSQEPISGFNQFRVDKLLDNSLTDFDLFVKVGTHFILYSGNG